METDELIRRLAMSARPVSRLRPPWMRVAQWLAVALPSVAIVVMLMSPRDDLVAKLSEMPFLIEQTAAFATAVTASIIAFCMIIPGYSRKLVLLPLAPLALWLGSLGRGCLESWLHSDSGSLQLSPDWICFPSIAIVGAVPAAAMVAMLRRGAPMAPKLTVALGALAAAALGNFGLRLFHDHDASLMVLVWQFGSVAFLSALAGWGGDYILRWPRTATTG